MKKRKLGIRHAAILLGGLVGLAVIFLVAFNKPAVADALVWAGNRFFAGRFYSLPVADRFYRAALAADPEVSDAWHQRARIDFLNGNFDSALVKINQQLKERGDELMASYYIRGLIEGYAEDYPAAELDFKRFLEWDPNNWAANNDLAWIYFAQGKFKEAEAQATIGLSRSESNPWLHTMRAMSRYNQGVHDGVKEELELALREAKALSPEDWLQAYPGNDPKIAQQGLAEFILTIERNLALVHSEAGTR